MAKIDKWKKLREELKGWMINLREISNLTAEQSGALMAYATVCRLMTELEVSEKKLDKA